MIWPSYYLMSHSFKDIDYCMYISWLILYLIKNHSNHNLIYQYLSSTICNFYYFHVVCVLQRKQHHFTKRTTETSSPAHVESFSFIRYDDKKHFTDHPDQELNKVCESGQAGIVPNLQSLSECCYKEMSKL